MICLISLLWVSWWVSGGVLGGGHDIAEYSVHVRVTFLSEGTTTCLCSFGFMFFWVRCVLCLGDVHMYCVDV